MLGVLIHVIGDAINNIGVIIAALIIWKAKGKGRYYADPAVGLFIAIMIFLTAVPLTRRSGAILLQTAPAGIVLEDVKHDIERVSFLFSFYIDFLAAKQRQIPGVESVHELHIWRLNQEKVVASAHIVIERTTVTGFMDRAKVIMECLHAYGVHFATLQPEAQNLNSPHTTSISVDTGLATRGRGGENSHCQLGCGNFCDESRCCGPQQSH